MALQHIKSGADFLRRIFQPLRLLLPTPGTPSAPIGDWKVMILIFRFCCHCCPWR